ncbi:MAG: AAA family ATPase [Deltaproteobacteria bacterium]|jgi:DNA polymerase III delta prime subunit|nr:AAA family ATPase [Deltaproteobacteria bacterium]
MLYNYLNSSGSIAHHPLLVNGGNLTLSDGPHWLDYHSALFIHRSLELTRSLGHNCLDSIRICLGNDQYLDILNKRYDITNSDSRNWGYELDELTKFIIRKLQKSKPLTYQAAVDDLLTALSEKVKSIETIARQSTIENNLQSVSELLELNIAESGLVRLLLLARSSPAFHSYLFDEIKTFYIANRPILAAFLAVTISEANSAFSGRLNQMGFLKDSQTSAPELERSFFRLLENPQASSGFAPFSQSPEPTLGESDFPGTRQTLAHLKALILAPSQSPTHILFYGPVNSGKTQMARFLAKELGGRGFEVRNEESVQEHRNNLFLAHSYLKRDYPENFLIIDEADKLLKTTPENSLLSLLRDDDQNKSQKNWLEFFLNKPGPACVWIVENYKIIQDSIKNLFAYSVRFAKLGAQARFRIWRRNQVSLNSELLSDNSLFFLARNFEVSPNVIAQSLEKTLAMGTRTETQALTWLNTRLRAHLDLCDQTKTPARVSSHYRPDVLVTSPPIDDLLPGLLKWRDHNQSLPVEERQGMRLLFYGPPGTGKTELATYLAQELELELAQARLSDIVSKYVGESEKNLAGFFKKFASVLGIVQIDEVESFLYSRDKAVRSYEISLVNEFLTCLDNFTGLFIGSTNRIKDLDQAAIRRLGRRVKFGPLAQSGRLELFKSFLSPLSGLPLTKNDKTQLSRLSQLAPSDFSAVANSLNYFSSKPLKNIDLLVALEKESLARLGALD